MSFQIGDVVRFVDYDDSFSDTLTVIGRKWVGTDRAEISYTLLDAASPNAEILCYGSELVFVRGPLNYSRCPAHDYSFHCAACEVEQIDFPSGLEDAVNEILKMHVNDRCGECGKGSPCPTRTILLRATELKS